MSTSEPNPLEKLLADYVCALVGEREWSGPERGQLTACVREALFRPELDAQELPFSKREAGGSRRILEAAMCARVERALQVVLDEAGRLAGVTGLKAPAVVIQRNRDRGGTDCAATLVDPDPAATLVDVDRREPPPDPAVPSLVTGSEIVGDNGILVLGDEGAINRFFEDYHAGVHGDSDTGAATSRSVRINLKAGLRDTRAITGGPANANIQVLEATTGLNLLEDALCQALDTKPRAARKDHRGRLFHGKYEIQERIGSGGFGTVYRALDRILGTAVAIKVLDVEPNTDPKDLEAFKDEARRVTRLNHPNIVEWKVFDELEDGTCYFVMELLEGEDLAQVLEREERLEPRRVASILLQVVDALRFAHDLGDGQAILHLDLKPKNVFLLPGRPGHPERVKVIDFGIGQHVGGPAETTWEIPGDDARADAAVPQTVGKVAGCTPEYASPEQCTHFIVEEPTLALDGRSDLYSLGVMGFRMLTGSLPFEPLAHSRDYIDAHLRSPPLKVGAQGVRVPRRLAEFVDRCLVKDRDRRFRDSEQAWRVLHRIVHPPPLRLIAGIVAGVVGVLSLAGVVFWPEPGPAPADVYLVDDAGERDLPQGVLYLDLKHPLAMLRTAGLVEPAPAVRLVGDRDPDSATLAGWSAAWDGPGTLTVRADAATAASHGRAYLELSGAEHRQYSVPFELALLRPGAWHVDSVEVVGLGSKDLDPIDRTLEVSLGGRVDAVASVLVGVGEDEYLAGASTADAKRNSAVWALDLEAVDLSAGTRRLVVRALDHAGHAERSELEVRVVDGALSITGATLAAPQSGGVYHLVPGARPELRLAANRRARFGWSIRDSSGAELGAGTCADVESPSTRLPDFSELSGGGPVSGWIEVHAQDSEWVSHARGSGRDRDAVKLPFVLHDEQPEVVLRLDGGRSGDVAELEPGGTYYRNRSAAKLHLAKTNTVPTEVEVRLRRRGDQRPSDGRVPVDLGDPAVTSAGVDLSFDADGSWDLRARAFRAGAAPEDAADELDCTIVVDSTPPRVNLSGNSQVILRAGAPAPELSLVLHDTWNEDPTPVALRLLVARASDGEPVLSELLAEAALPGPKLAFALPSALDELADGKYEARVEGVDVAGNAALPAEFGLHVARVGPLLDLVKPAAQVEWNPGESGSLELSFVAQDPNDTESVRCEIARAGDDSGSLPVNLERRETAQAGVSRWTGRVVVPPAWSGERVELRARGRDRFGAESGVVLERTLGEVLEIRPGLVEVAGGESGTMRLVRGNARGAYVFGGRSDEIEGELFRQSGLGDYNRHTTARSWEITYARAAIADYYLDEDEVSCGQYRAFLCSEGSGSIDGERRAWLEQRLAQWSVDRPVAEVTWEEARAYAEWVGKRLPSMVEWEYALRGGLAYRPLAADGAADPTRINFDPTQDFAGQAWSRGTGADLTPDTSIRDLSGNIAEWTATPFAFQEPTPPNLAAHLRGWRAEVLDPRRYPRWERAGRYWVVGGSYRTPRCDFSVVDSRDRDWHDAEIGFRCAVSAARVIASMRGEDPNGTPFREVER